MKERVPGLKVVAPLEFLAEGLVLLTTDGALGDALTRHCRVPMTYHLKLQGAVTDKNLERLLHGWTWEGRRVQPTRAEIVASTQKNTWIELVLPEIRMKALKAAGDVVRHAVLKISRTRFGGIPFEDIPMAGWRELKKTEAADLRRAAGLA